MPAGEPAVALPSSTVLLLREESDADGPFSVLLLERHRSVAFPGAHAFPGGVVDPGDAEVPAAGLPPGQCWAPAGEGDAPPEAVRYWVAAVRELFEEAGILLAEHAGGPLEGPLPAAVHALRARLHAGEPFGCLLAEAELRPATHTLQYFARWVTPAASSRRFDTRFLVGRVPAGQEAIIDGTETVSCAWYTPRAALAAYEAGSIQLIPPTVLTLHDLADFESASAVLADARQREVRPAIPQFGSHADEPAMDYRPGRRLVLRDGRWRLAAS